MVRVDGESLQFTRFFVLDGEDRRRERGNVAGKELLGTFVT